VAKVVGFVEAPALGLDLPLDVRGTAFQQRVWQALRRIRPARRRLLADRAAHRLAESRAAVAHACATNAIPSPFPATASCATRLALGLPLGRRAQARATRT